MITLWKTTLVVREHLLGCERARTPWKTIARQAGYADESGTRVLLRRKLDTAQTAVGFAHLHELLSRLDALVGKTP